MPLTTVLFAFVDIASVNSHFAGYRIGHPLFVLSSCKGIPNPNSNTFSQFGYRLNPIKRPEGVALQKERRYFGSKGRKLATAKLPLINNTERDN